MKTVLRAYLLGLALCVVLLPRAASAQWTLDASVGRAVHDPVSATLNAHSVILGLHHTGRTWGYVSGGAPLDSGTSLWGATGVGRRVGVVEHRTTFGVDLAAHGVAYRDGGLQALGGAVTSEILPLIGLGTAPVRVEVRSGLVHHATVYESPDGSQTTSRAVHHTDARLNLKAGSSLSVGGEGRYLRAAEDAYPYVGAGWELADGRWEAWGHAGRWLSDASPSFDWGLGASFGLDGRTEIRASFQQDPTHPLFWNKPRRTWSLGLSRKLGRRHTPSAPLMPEIVGEEVVVRLPLAGFDSAPAVAGDFTGWSPVPMTRSGDFWVARFRVSSGVYHYAFRRADGTWFVPADLPHRVDDGMGGESALLLVP